jgi:succinate-semialdehyde dehydrogenase/glutarate-semialdehyde dehydrogenase
MNQFVSQNPFTNEVLNTYTCLQQNELEQFLQFAYNAQQKWQKIPVKERLAPLVKLEELLKQEADALALLAAQEIGKPIAQARLEVLKCITLCTYYCQHAEEILKPKVTHTDKGNVHQLYEPMGVVLGIFPWNFPFWQILRSAIPVAIGGNAMLIKPAPNMPQCALALQALIDKAGFIPNVLQTIFITVPQTEMLIADKRIAAVTLTGSDAAGSAVAQISGKYIKKTVLELGGSDPLIILNDADIEKHLPEIVLARIQNNGQSCVAAKRLLVHEEIKEKFTNSLINYCKTIITGNPTNPTVQMGPLARPDLKQKLEMQVNESVKMGAKIIWQGQSNCSSPSFFNLTILDEIPFDAPAAMQELFGPVFSLFSFNNIDEAITLANRTPYGLGASIFTENIELAMQMATRIQCGMVHINQMVKSDVRFPFGGTKQSGYGKELGENGLKEFCNIKTIWVN